MNVQDKKNVHGHREQCLVTDVLCMSSVNDFNGHNYLTYRLVLYTLSQMARPQIVNYNARKRIQLFTHGSVVCQGNRFGDTVFLSNNAKPLLADR